MIPSDLAHRVRSCHPMTRLLLVLLLLHALPTRAADAPAPPLFDAQGHTLGPPLSERVTDYELEARLDPSTHQLTGRETIHWHNRSTEPQSTLWFHLYWNAFKNDRSTFYRDAKVLGGVRDENADSDSFPNRKPDEWGYSDVKAVRVQGGADLLPTLRFQHPADDNAEDQTVFTLTLPEPVPPGGRVTLELQWEARVPKAVARAGRNSRGYYMLGQWFPKLGVLEVPPERGVTSARWNCHQYHATSEFYADFGTYDARVTVPQRMKLGATGLLVERHDNPDGTATAHYHQDDVHDFAWTAWENAEVLEDVFRSPGLPEVALTVLLDPRHHRSGPQLLESAKASLEHYGRWWGPWPYRHLTLVAPPADASATNGMEYPTFIAVVGREYPGEPRDFSVWVTVAHEFGHNYWQGLLASNEFEESWLDEGINSYGTYRLMYEENVPVRTEDFLPWPLRGVLGPMVNQELDDRTRMSGMTSPSESSPILQPAWKFRDLSDYFHNSYNRTQVTLYALEQWVGEETLQRILHTYVERWKFRHPRSEDFFAVASEVSGKDLTPFFDTFFRGTGTLDYAVSVPDCDERRGPKGIFDEAPGAHVLRERNKDEPPAQRCEVQVSRRGDVRLPVELKVTFEDGTTHTESWDGQERWKRFVFEWPGDKGDISLAEVHGLDVLDAQPSNNSQTSKLSGHVAIAMFGWLTYLGQLVSTLPSLLL